MAFISLEDYLLLTDPTDKWKRSAHRTIRSPERWVRFYEIAKASYEKYGDSGPPFGSKVITLVSGHGGFDGAVRTLKGIFERDPRFFSLTRNEHRYPGGPAEERESLALRAHWWNEFREYDNTYMIMNGRVSFWHSDGWSNVWLTALRWEDKAEAEKVFEQLKNDNKFNKAFTARVVHSEDWSVESLR